MKAKFYKTKAGNGFKILVDGKWLYAYLFGCLSLKKNQTPI